MGEESPHLEAEQANGVDDVVLAGGAGGGQHGGHVVHAQGEEQQKAQHVAPDVHCLVRQDEDAAGQQSYYPSWNQEQAGLD